ncbi:putative fatty acyl-CoA reductase CG5065 [Culicoides brevitarsis]|uniref:putative fatty acyl-CoA reductase CG5065 n=1 Tax=Culicoides brevitarsis TaxID=469753 RepID=UPI00307C838E
MDSLMSIKSFMRNATVLISGATGFIGKVLVEKLLRECPELANIYILVRPKKGTDDITSRFAEYKENIIFDHIKQTNPSVMEKLLPIQGDLMQNGLGMHENDYRLLCESVNIVYHCAASVRFSDPLKIAIKLNSLGTKQMLDLAEQAKNLKAFVHVSTAFSNVQEKLIKEAIYEPLFDYHAVIEATLNDNDAFLVEAERKILKLLPNTYVYSKNVGEKLVDDVSNRMPVCIVRPSVVCPSYRDPYPGWVDSINGPASVLLGASTGLLRCVHGKGHLTPDLLPVDFASNATIAASVQCAELWEKGGRNLQVFNLTTSSEIPITWNDFLQLGRKTYEKYPSKRAFWYPGGRMYKNYWVFVLAFTVIQFIPALVLDGLLAIIQRPRWLVRTQKKIWNNMKLFDYFLQHQWKWENDNLLKLYHRMELSDQYTFNFDATIVDYPTYIGNWIFGYRKFILKQGDESLPSAKRKYMMLYYIDFVTKLLLIGLLDFLLRKLPIWDFVGLSNF